MAQVFLLLFEDDVALVFSKSSGLEKQLDNLKGEADGLKLEVLLAKASIIMLRKGGPLSHQDSRLVGMQRLKWLIHISI